MKVIATSGKLYLAQISATEVAKLKGFTSLIAWRKAFPDVAVIGCEIDVGQALADVGEGTVGRKKIEAVRDRLAAEMKRLDDALGVDPPEPTEIEP